VPIGVTNPAFSDGGGDVSNHLWDRADEGHTSGLARIDLYRGGRTAVLGHAQPRPATRTRPARTWAVNVPSEPADAVNVDPSR
jgi:hypothetical protein